MSYGAGASARLWRKLLPKAELWEAEVDAECVDKHRGQLAELNIRPLVGAQQDNVTLQAWLAKSGGGFDIVVRSRRCPTETAASFGRVLRADGGVYMKRHDSLVSVTD